MTARLDYAAQSPELFKKLGLYSHAAHTASIEAAIIDLVNIRASQLNGCGFCLDMHVKEATLRGERPLRLHHLAGVNQRCSARASAPAWPGPKY
ncbi:carboxymuconolactone decarboxylase family protein [Stenotrophomonas maltophilia]|uniref:carboxymuconolactone decarboxylase family protein n=1 Tax=Stenotrophomonas maltophilia TaxID=40324 RepID=UPI000A519389|nr:carboxymuconolactone decarboxylase family protein [Stenotrophomonas maltophilia]